MKLVSGSVRSGRTRYVLSKYIYPNLQEGKTVYYYGEHTAESLYDMLSEYHQYETKNTDISSNELIEALRGNLVYLRDLSLLPGDIENSTIILDRLIVGNEELYRFNNSNVNIIKIVQLGRSPEDIVAKDVLIDDDKMVKFNPIMWTVEKLEGAV